MNVSIAIGMLSIANGQVLRVAAVLHVLFCDTVDEVGELTVQDVPVTVTSKAVLAARNFVDTCCQHAAFIAGRGLMEDEISQLTSSKSLSQNLSVINVTITCHSSTGNVVTTPTGFALAAYCMLLPGKELNLSALLSAKKFRRRGNKDGAGSSFSRVGRSRTWNTFYPGKSQRNICSKYMTFNHP